MRLASTTVRTRRARRAAHRCSRRPGSTPCRRRPTSRARRSRDRGARRHRLTSAARRRRAPPPPRRPSARAAAAATSPTVSTSVALRREHVPGAPAAGTLPSTTSPAGGADPSSSTRPVVVDEREPGLTCGNGGDRRALGDIDTDGRRPASATIETCCTHGSASTPCRARSRSTPVIGSWQRMPARRARVRRRCVPRR